MPERLIEVLVPTADAERVQASIEQSELEWSWNQSADGTTVFKLLAPAEQVESILDPLEALLKGSEGARLLVLPIEAAFPRREDDAGRGADDASALRPPEKLPGRISRNELYEDLNDFAKITPAFLVTVVLSTVVAAIGLARNSPAVTIGAMVIAPLLGPNMALALATTLGDMKLATRALRANAAGVAVALGLSMLAGLVWTLDLGATEVASRTVVSFGEILLALATGTAGALAVTTGVSSSLVGVMVAVALLPPLVIASMLLVQGHAEAAANAYLLLATNVVCVNLSGVATFYFQGIKPRTWWEEKKAKRATRYALSLWLGLLALVTVLVALSPSL